jgi:hypothetical protein
VQYFNGTIIAPSGVAYRRMHTFVLGFFHAQKVQSFTRVTSTQVSQLLFFFKKKGINWRKSIEMFISRLQQPIGSICRVISLPTPGPTLFQPTFTEISPLGSLGVKEIWNFSGQVELHQNGRHLGT